MSKTSKAIKLYIATMIIVWILNITQLWNKIFELILKIGVENIQLSNTIEEICIKPDVPVARRIGVLVGGVVLLVIILGMIRLKNWARKLLLFFSFSSLIIYIFNLPKLLFFYKNIASGKLWLGYYLFGFFVLMGIGYLSSVIIFFLSKDVKKEFRN